MCGMRSLQRVCVLVLSFPLPFLLKYYSFVTWFNIILEPTLYYLFWDFFLWFSRILETIICLKQNDLMKKYLLALSNFESPSLWGLEPNPPEPPCLIIAPTQFCPCHCWFYKQFGHSQCNSFILNVRLSVSIWS